MADSAEAWELMSDEEKLRYSFRQVCRRILDTDPRCSREMGCPADLVAFPMLLAWRERQGLTHNDSPEFLRRFLAADGQGRSCEIQEISFLAQRFLDEGE